MKKILFSAILALSVVPVLASAATLNVVSNPTDASYYDAVTKTADRIVSLQDPVTGGFGWVVTGQTSFSGTGGAPFLNVTGVTAEALLSAYALTGKAVYLDAAKRAGDFIIARVDSSSPKSINGYNVLFLQHLSSVAAISTYSDKAAEYLAIIYSTTPTTLCAAGCVDSNGLYAGYLTTRGWSTSSPNGIPAWDLASFVEYLVMVGDTVHANELEATIVSNLSVATSTMPNYELGIASGLKASALVGDTANRDIYAGLLSSSDGSYGSSADGKIQTTAYVLRAFKQTGDSRSTAAAQYLVGAFSPSGTPNGWLETDGTEYLEDDSEAASAVALMLPAGIKYYSVQSALDAAAENDTVSIASGTYIVPAQLNVTKTVTLQGMGIVTVTPFADFGSVNGSKHLLLVTAGTTSSPVSISNLTFDCDHKCFGIQAYNDAHVTLNNVTVSNSKGAGVTVNGSMVEATNIITSGNTWGGINVDLGGGITTPAQFTVRGVSVHSEPVQIWIDDITKPATVVDVDSQYTATTTGNTAVYTLKNKNIKTASDDHTTSTSGDVAVTFDLPSMIISGNESWDGIVDAPTATTTTVTLPGFDTTVSSAIAVGSNESNLTLENAAKLTFAGQAGKRVGWYNHEGVFAEITDVCSSDSQTTGDALPTGGNCKIDSGSDLVVWTKHLTVFVTFTATVTPPAPVSSGGGYFISSPSANASPVAQFVATNTPNTAGQVLGATVSALASQGNNSGKGKVLGASISAFVRDMKSGARGDDVIELQNRLIAEGHLKIKAATGYFGPFTKAALIKWQLKHKLPGTGYFGQLSRALLNNQ